MKLIYFPENKLVAKGGPAGYLCNLKDGIEVFTDEFAFLPDSSGGIESNQFLKKLIPSKLKDRRRLRNTLSLLNKTIEPTVDFSKFELIHFHSTEDMYYVRDELEDYRGVVVLTSHSPCAYHRELIARLNPKDAQQCQSQLDRLKQIDEYAFKRADYVVFPCEEAEEPYFHTWSDYASFRKKEKLRYLPTGIAGCSAKESRESVRTRLGIPESAFVLCYAGRHNEIKGYGDLCALGKNLLKDDNVWVLVAGKEGPLETPRHNRWIEVGWTNDPHSLISASDVFVLPNRETYFDLILLEALSLGSIVVASSTGGNKYFSAFEQSGIILYNNLKEAEAGVISVMAMSQDQKLRCKEGNILLFEQHFSNKVFVQGYIDLIRELEEAGAQGVR